MEGLSPTQRVTSLVLSSQLCEAGGLRRKAALVLHMASLVSLEKEGFDLARACITSAYRLYGIDRPIGSNAGMKGAGVGIRKSVLASAAYISKLAGRLEETIR